VAEKKCKEERKAQNRQPLNILQLSTKFRSELTDENDVEKLAAEKKIVSEKKLFRFFHLIP
jgi:hypothetical protein